MRFFTCVPPLSAIVCDLCHFLYEIRNFYTNFIILCEFSGLLFSDKLLF